MNKRGRQILLSLRVANVETLTAIRQPSAALPAKATYDLRMAAKTTNPNYALLTGGFCRALILVSILFYGLHPAIAEPLADSPTQDDLLSLYKVAQTQDATLRAAQAARDANREVLPQAFAPLLPQLSARFNEQRNKQEVKESVGFSPSRISRFSSDSVTVQLSQTLFSWSAFNNLRVAQQQSAIAGLDYRIAEQDLILRLVEVYFDVLAATDSLQFATAERSAIEQQLQQAKRRFELGAVAIVDVHETQARFDLAVAQEIEARFDLRSARRSLQSITNRQDRGLSALPEKLALSPPTPADSNLWANAADRSNLQLLRAQATETAARRNISQQRGGHFPSLSIVGNYRENDTTDDRFIGSISEDSNIGLQLDIPLSEGGAVLSRVREAEARWLQRSAELEQTRRQTRQQALDNYDGVESTIARVAALRQAVLSNQTALKTVEAGLRLGARTNIDVLDAQQQLYRAQADLSRARYDYYLQTLRLKQTTGQLSVSDLEEISATLVSPTHATRSNPTTQVMPSAEQP